MTLVRQFRRPLPRKIHVTLTNKAFTAMTTFKETRDLLVVAYDESLLTDEELFSLYDFYASENLDLLDYSYPKFDIDDLEGDERVSEFCFHKGDLFSLAEALQIPAVLKTKQKNVVDGMEGLCMLLRRFAYPCRYSDMVPRFCMASASP